MTIERIDPAGEIEVLAEILHACVHGGAGVSFVLPFSMDEARAFWRGVEGRLVLAAREAGKLVGTVSLAPATPPNQPHRTEVAKLLVHPGARRRGVARALMVEAERVARAQGSTLLTLDTVTGDRAELLYRSLGYVLLGVVPGYALAPDGKTLVAASFYYKPLEGAQSA